MRKHVITEYKSILDLLIRQGGCPVCAFLKNEQASLLQRSSDLTGPLCNAHAWGFAAVGDAGVAASALLRSLEQLGNPAQKRLGDCWLCGRLQLSEDRAVADLSSGKGRTALGVWLQDGRGLCAPHSARLRRSSSPQTARLIENSDSHKRSELITALKALTSPERKGVTEQAGALGRAAEYLVSQRGLPGWQDLVLPPRQTQRRSAKSRG